MDDWAVILTNVATSIIVVFGVGLLLRKYLPSYFEQKGKNLATKEDIEEITEKTERARRRQRQKEEKAKTLLDYLNQFGRLTALYSLWAREESRLLGTFKSGSVLMIAETGPEPHLAQAFEDKHNISLQSAIYQTTVDTHILSGMVFDIIDEVDPSGDLKRKFERLDWQINKNLKGAVEGEDFEAITSKLKEANKMRREIYTVIQKYIDSP